MTRRRFFKQIGAVVSTLAVPNALPAAARLAAPAGLALGPSAGATSRALEDVGLAQPMPLHFNFFRRLADGECVRLRWYEVWRRYRVARRRKLVNPKPANLVWREARLKDLRQNQGARQRLQRGEDAVKFRRSRSSIRSDARQRNAFRLAGLPWPWDRA